MNFPEKEMKQVDLGGLKAENHKEIQIQSMSSLILSRRSCYSTSTCCEPVWLSGANNVAHVLVSQHLTFELKLQIFSGAFFLTNNFRQ